MKKKIIKAASLQREAAISSATPDLAHRNTMRLWRPYAADGKKSEMLQNRLQISIRRKRQGYPTK